MRKIKSIRRLNRQYLEDIRALEARCNEFDQTERSLYLSLNGNTINDVKCFYLCYDEELLGFLSLTNLDENDIELTAFVHPERRHEGIFKQLVAKALKECEKAEIKEIFVYQNPKHQVSKVALLSVGAEFLYSDYRMELSLNEELLNRTVNEEKLVSLREIELNQKEIYTKHLMSLFGMDEEVAAERFEDAVQEPRLTTFITYKGNTPIGFLSLFFGSTAATLFDVGICKKYQGHGYANSMLCLVYQLIVQRKEGIKKILLHVSSYNEVAVGLYHKHGFEVTDQLDYYRIAVGANRLF